MSSSLQKKEKLNWFVLIETFLCILIVWFICTKNHDRASTVFAASFVVLLYSFVKYFTRKNKILDELDGYLISITISSFLSVLISLLISGKGLSFENLKQYFIFLSSIIFFRLSEKTILNRRTANYLFLFNMAISVIYIYSKKYYPQEYSKFSSNSLTLNFDNPNLTGMFVFISLLYMILGFIYFEKIILKAVCAVLAITNFSLLMQTESRNPLLALALFVIILCICFFKANVHFSKGFNFIVNIAPTVFFVSYLTFINVIIEKGWLDFFVSKGKPLNSRIVVWQTALEKLGKQWLLGNYAYTSGNAHNSHMVLLCSFGLVGLILTVLFTYRITVTISNRANKKFQTYALAAFFAVIFMGFGEGALYSGGLGLYLLAGGFLMLANSDFDENKAAN